MMSKAFKCDFCNGFHNGACRTLEVKNQYGTVIKVFDIYEKCYEKLKNGVFPESSELQIEKGEFYESMD